MPKPAKARRLRTTADMVAEAANVSRAAVSRAFNAHTSIKPEKRDRILKIAHNLNYTPDRAARALATRRSHLIGIIIPDVCSPWESQEIDALATAIQAEGFATLLFKTQTDRSMDSTLLSYMKAYNPDSVIVFTENVRPELLSEVLDRATPIYVNYPGADGGNSSEDDADAGRSFDCINVLQHGGIDQAIALLQGYGKKRIAYLSGDLRTSASAERERALVGVMKARGLPAPVIVKGDFTYDTAHAGVLDLFRVGDGADAIFAANDVSAFGAIDALRYSLNLSVPGDVSVVGFDDIHQASWRAYNLTTVKIDLQDRVRAFMRLIHKRLKTPSAPSLSETIETRLVVRGTVG